MLNKILEFERIKPQDFQVLFLRNDATQEVEIHEVAEVDFSTVKERLERGDSVFITSKNTQKVKPPKLRSNPDRNIKRRLATAVYASYM